VLLAAIGALDDLEEDPPEALIGARELGAEGRRFGLLLVRAHGAAMAPEWSVSRLRRRLNRGAAGQPGTTGGSSSGSTHEVRSNSMNTSAFSCGDSSVVTQPLGNGWPV